MTWIQTRFGRMMDLADPQPDDIDIRDIAHSLAITCRFAGHTVRFYSVAEHSFWVGRLLEHDGEPRERVLAGLLHDAAEAYVGDVTRPLKQALRALGEPGERSTYDKVSDAVDHAIHVRFGLTAYRCTPKIKSADMRMLAVEQKHLMTTPPEEWKSTEDYTEDDIAAVKRVLNGDVGGDPKGVGGASWPQELRFPVGRSAEWNDIFLLEFARLTGGPLCHDR
jgi:hypothetical protein